MSNKLLQKIIISKPVVLLVNSSKKIVIPFSGGANLYEVISTFSQIMQKSSITTRATSLSFSFLLTVFPGIIFFFSIIPYIPINNFQDTLLVIIKDISPNTTYNIISGTIEDIVKSHHGGLLSVGFIFTLYFAVNCINRIIVAFNATYHITETRSGLKRRLISVIIALILFVIVIIAIILIIFGTSTIRFLVNQEILKGIFTSNTICSIIQVLKWIIITGMLFFSISFLYYLAPAKRKKFRFISIGSILATLSIFILSSGFNYYISHFSRYNKIYGSIGTLIILLLWIYFNATILLAGFELNASISIAKKNNVSD